MAILFMLIDFLVVGILHFLLSKNNLLQFSTYDIVLLFIVSIFGYCLMSAFVFSKRKMKSGVTLDRMNTFFLLVTIGFFVLCVQCILGILFEKKVLPISIVGLNTFLPAVVDFLFHNKQSGDDS